MIHIAISRQYAVVINDPDDIKVYSIYDDDGTQMRRIADELGMAYPPDCTAEQLAEMLLDEFALALPCSTMPHTLTWATAQNKAIT